MVAREGLDRQVYPLVTFKIVITVKALWALVALERPIVGGGLLMLCMSHEVWHGCSMAAVEARHHTRMHTHKRKLAIRVLYV